MTIEEREINVKRQREGEKENANKMTDQEKKKKTRCIEKMALQTRFRLRQNANLRIDYCYMRGLK